jgi:hypothetical protein
MASKAFAVHQLGLARNEARRIAANQFQVQPVMWKH